MTSPLSTAVTYQSFSYWLKKNWYYHYLLKNFYSFVIPAGRRVLHIGCKNGYLLKAVSPSYGVGIDTDAFAIDQARQENPQFSFMAGEISDLPLEQFDYLILSAVTVESYDVQQLFERLLPYTHAGTRVVIDSYSHLWEPVLSLAQRLGLRRKTPFANWLSRHDLKNFLYLAGYEVITSGSQILIPVYIPGISWFVNTFIAPLPLIQHLCVSQWMIVRPLPTKHAPTNSTTFSEEAKKYSVSVIITCRNERGNILEAVKQCPDMGNHTELIFVEGHSHDGTLEEIKRVQTLYPQRDISWYVQDGIGKGDAVRKGFAQAKGDILMILDGDLTTPPQEMPKFVAALVQGKGDFINGSRLVYGMETGSMRFLNLIANHCFAHLFTWLLGQPIKDTLCGTKVLFKKDYEHIVHNRSYFGDFDPFGDFDLLFGAAKQNLKIIDMPVHYKNRVYGTSQISRFKAGWLLLRMSLVAMKKLKFKF